MDPFAHTMAGAVLARVGLDRRTPLAAATLMLGANAPDIDIYTVWTQTAFGSIAFRRGWTHGPLAWLLLPFVITALVLAWDRWVRRRRDPTKPAVDPRWALILAAIGVLSHPALDWLNSYGIRFLMPFTERWFYGDSVFIIDPYWWVLLATTLVLARRGASLRTVRSVAALALTYPLALLGASRVGDRIAVAAAAEQGIVGVTEVMYQPAIANPLAAQLVAVTPEAYHFGTFRWTESPKARFEGDVIPRGDWASPIVAAAQQDADVRDYLVWSRYPWVRVDTTDAGEPQSVVFGDARFPSGGLAGGLGGLRVPAR